MYVPEKSAFSFRGWSLESANCQVIDSRVVAGLILSIPDPFARAGARASMQLAGYPEYELLAPVTL